MIIGVDEVGRGAWAGPMVVGAVALNGATIPSLTDSKKLTPKKRQHLAKLIKESGASIGLGWVSAETIDKIGLSEALKLAARLAVKEIEGVYEQIIIDGTIRLIDDSRVSTLKQADLLVPSVSAASIMAKVARDYYMSRVVIQEYPHYAFEKHVGYGTQAHRQALQQYGATNLHRLSFDPVRKTLDLEISEKKKSVIEKTAGRQAERVAEAFLKQKGYEIIDLNWRTKLCEIDIIAARNGVVHLVEVKYREKTIFGDGISAISAKKLNQMKFAARVWRHWQKYDGDVRLSVLSLSGKDFVIDQWLEEII